MNISIVFRDNLYAYGERNLVENLAVCLDWQDFKIHICAYEFSKQVVKERGTLWDIEDIKGTLKLKEDLDKADFIIFTKPWQQVIYEMMGGKVKSCVYLSIVPGYAKGFEKELSERIFEYIHDPVILSTSFKIWYHSLPEIIPPSFDFKSLRAQIQNENSKKVFDYLWIGYNDKTKGIDRLFDISKQCPDKRFCVILSGEDKVCLSKNCNVFYNVPRSNVLGVMKHTKKLLITSWFEAFGLVIFEAMAADLPIFVYDSPYCCTDFDFVTRFSTIEELENKKEIHPMKYHKRFSYETIGKMWKKYILNRMEVNLL